MFFFPGNLQAMLHTPRHCVSDIFDFPKTFKY